MKEAVRDWNHRGSIKVKYRDGNGIICVWEANQDKLLAAICVLVEKYQKMQIKLSNRQLYYQLVTMNIIPNADEIYKRICVFLTDARYGGFIDWDAIEDRGRDVRRHGEWDNVSALIGSAIAAYRRRRWANQDYYVEMYCEKEALDSVLRPVADFFHIFFGYNKGYTSAAVAYELSKRAIEQLEDGKIVRILYMGDHDSSGLDMVRDVEARVNEFIKSLSGMDESEYDFEVVPLALKMEQIQQYNPPPNPAKITDPRAKGYVKRFGAVSWELDSLRPEVLRDIAKEGIEEFLDKAKYDKIIKKENNEKVALEEFGERWLDEHPDEEENEDEEE